MAAKLYFTLQSTSAPVRLLFLLCRLNFEPTLKISEAAFFFLCAHWRIAVANIADSEGLLLFDWTEVKKREV